VLYMDERVRAIVLVRLEVEVERAEVVPRAVVRAGACVDVEPAEGRPGAVGREREEERPAPRPCEQHRRTPPDGGRRRAPATPPGPPTDSPPLSRLRRGTPPIDLNNPCMTLRPRSVIDAISRYYSEFPTCGGGRTEGSRKLNNWFMEELREHELAAREALR